MKMLQISAQTLPLYVSKPGEKVPPLVGSIPANLEYTAKAGDMVAALTKVVDKGSDEENWIMAEVISYSHHTQKYEIHDIDEEQKPRHILSRRRVIPLPLYRANPETDPNALFTKGSVVMALYPQTTCFYKGECHMGGGHAIIPLMPFIITSNHQRSPGQCVQGLRGAVRGLHLFQRLLRPDVRGTAICHLDQAAKVLTIVDGESEPVWRQDHDQTEQLGCDRVIILLSVHCQRLKFERKKLNKNEKKVTLIEKT
jgi:hypothetical protein